MIVYTICPSEKYGFFTTGVLADTRSFISDLRGSTLGKRNYDLKRSEDPLGNVCPIEMSCLTVAIDLNAKNCIKLNNKGISLLTNKEYEIIIPSVIDALDVEKSDITYFSGTKQIKRIAKYYFKVNRLKDIDLFIIPNCLTPVMCTDRFYDCCKQNKLTGVSFKMIFQE